jgi:hypothetical protein
MASPKCYGPKTKVARYITGLDRNEPKVVAHLYATAKGPMDPYAPMCARGWNRENGHGFSILRGNVGPAGVCRVCQRRAAQELPPVKPLDRKTKWL